MLFPTPKCLDYRWLTVSGVLVTLLSIASFAQVQYTVTSRDNVKLHVREFGSGEPVIFLAGGPGLNADYLQPVWEKLGTTFRCIIPDQRGTGKSFVSSVDSTSMAMQRYVDDLNALREHLKVESLILLGHSWGGMLAMEFAAHYPDHIKSLILIGPGGPTEKFLTYFGDNMAMRLHDSDRQEIALMDSLKKSPLPGLLPGYFFNRDAAMKLKESIDFDGIYGQPHVNDYTMSSYLLGSDDRSQTLRRYRGPVHIIQGRQDPIGESTAYEIKEVLPQTQIAFIEQCGHFPWLEGDAQQSAFFEVVVRSINKK